MFDLFNQKKMCDNIKKGDSRSLLAYEYDIDIEICDVQFQYTSMWNQKLRNKEITEEEMNFVLNYYNNVALTTSILIQVHKPGRYSKKEIEKIIEESLES